jgi:hypothetical protein
MFRCQSTARHLNRDFPQLRQTPRGGATWYAALSKPQPVDVCGASKPRVKSYGSRVALSLVGW